MMTSREIIQEDIFLKATANIEHFVDARICPAPPTKTKDTR
jgi:hypothetical protein